jgi:hypothetical protein
MATPPPAASPSQRPARLVAWGVAGLIATLGGASGCYAPGAAPAPADASSTDTPTDAQLDASTDAVLDATPDAATDTSPADTSAQPPELVVVATRLAEGEVHWALAAGPSAALLLRSDGWRWLDGAGERPIASAEAPSTSETAGLGPAHTLATIDADAARTLAAASLSDGDLFVGHPGGLLRIRDGVILEGPLTERFAGLPVTGLAAADGALWISSADGLHAFRDGALVPWTAPPHDFAGNLVAAGPRPALASAATPALAIWLAGAHGTSALWPHPEAPVLSLDGPDLTAPPVHALTATADGLVAVLAGTELSVRVPTAPRPDWGLALDAGVLAVAAHADAPGLWCLTAGADLYRVTASGPERAVGLPPSIAAAVQLSARPTGAVLIPTADGLFELSARRSVRVAGLSPDQRLSSATRLELRVSDPGLVTGITAALEGPGGPAAPLVVDAEGQGAAHVFAVSLDPHLLDNGAFSLRVAVSWEDGDTASAEVPFTVDFPTWSRDVRAIFERACANCHGRGNGGNFASLDTLEAWSSRLDDILCRVDVHGEGRAAECDSLPRLPSTMPPGGVLPASDAAALRAWRDAGFRP